MSTVKYTPRLADKYTKEVVPALSKKFGYKSVMQTPKLEKWIGVNPITPCATGQYLLHLSRGSAHGL